MSKLQFIVVDKIRRAEARRLCDDYLGRIKRNCTLEETEVKPVKGSADVSPKIRDEEARRQLSKIPDSSFVVALDERGTNLRSVELASRLQKWLEMEKSVSFVIGGAWGLGDAIKKRANVTLSLSAMTYPHELARVILYEQIYRAISINRNEPYHNE